MSSIPAISVLPLVSLAPPASSSGAAATRMAPSHVAAARSPRMTISEMHFLVHPLFLGDPFDKNSKEWIMSGHAEALQMDVRYKTQAARLKKHALMCMFSHLDSKELASRDDPYAKGMRTFVGEMHGILGARLMVFPSEIPPFDDYRAVRAIMREMRRRNLAMVEAPRYWAYGEVLGICVHDAAENLGDGFDIAEPVSVPLSLTDAVFWWKQGNIVEQNRTRLQFIQSGLRLVEDL